MTLTKRGFLKTSLVGLAGLTVPLGILDVISSREKPIKNIKEDTWTGIAWCKDLKLFIVVCDPQANKKKEDLLLVSSDGINWTKPDCITSAKLDNIYANMLRKI